MKKRFLIILLLFTFCFPVFSQINFFTPQVEHKARLAFQVNNYNYLYTFTLGTQAMVEADMKELQMKNGLEFYHTGFNLTNDITYAPTLFNVWNLGIRTINHFNWTYKTYLEDDFLIGGYTKYQPLPCLYISASVLYQIKSTNIYELRDSRKNLISTCPAVETVIDYNPLDWLDFTLSISSFTFTKYNLFFAPNTRLNIEFKVNPFLYIGIGGEVQFVDFFTLSANFNRFSSDVNVTWRF